MYRSVLLDFLSANSKTLLENNYSQMTLVLFPNEYQNLLNLYKDNSFVKIYHIKDNYTLYKEYEFSNIQGSIVEMILEYSEIIRINYEDINFAINDVYYLKDIRNLKFSSIELNPILDDQKLIGVAIIYSNNPNTCFNISNQKFKTLLNKLYLDEEIELSNSIVNTIVNNEQWHYVVKKNNKYYLNDLMSKSHHFKYNLFKDSDSEVVRLKKLLSNMKKITTESEEIYYLPNILTKTNLNNIEILLLDSINNHNFDNEFSVIFSKDLQSNENIFEYAAKFKEAISKIFPDCNIKFYQIQKDTIGIIVDKHFSKKEENELKYLLKKIYFVLITKTNGLTKGLDLIKLMTYFNYNLPFSFNYKEYSQYLDEQNVELLECDKAINRYNKIMIKADTLQTIGKIVNAPLKNYYNLAIYKLYESELINLLERIIKDDIESPIITMAITSFNKRKIYELLKKIIAKYPTSKLIFHAPKIMNHKVKEMYDNILKAKDMGFVVIIDSTIFMDFNYNICLKPSDAVIIRKGELNSALTTNNLFNKKMFESFYEDSKVVIFEELPKEEDLCIINELTCLFVDE